MNGRERRRLLRAWPALAAASALSFAAPRTVFAQAAEESTEGGGEEDAGPETPADRGGFGVFPSLALGVVLGPSPFADDHSSHPQTAFINGLYLEPQANLNYVFAGDRFALGATLGYVLQGLRFPDRPMTTDPDFGFCGPTLGVSAMVGLHPRVFLSVAGGGMLGWVARPMAVSMGNDPFTFGVRFGGGISFVLIRTSGVDVALRVEGTHTRSLEVTSGSQTLQWIGTNIGVNVSFSFVSDEMDTP